MRLNRTPNPLDRDARNGENDNWDIIEGETRRLNDKVDNFLNTLSEDAFNKVVDDIRLNWSHKVDNFSDLPSNPKKGDTVAVENDDMIYRYDGSNWIGVIPFTQFSAIAEIDNRLSSQLADIEESQFRDSMVSHKYLKPAILWIDDDGKKGVYDRLYPLFKSKGKVFTSALITANVDRRESDLTLEQILEMRDSGVVEFCSHSHYHGQQGKPQPRDATEEELYDDFKKSTDFLRRYELNHRAYVQPFGRSTELTKKVERNFFNCSFRTEGTRQLNPPTLPFDMYDIERFGLGEDLSFIKSKMDEAVANNSFLTLATHIDEFEVTDEKIIEIMDYADSIGIEFITVSEMVNRFGNLAQFGNTKIGANGDIESDVIGSYITTNVRKFDVDDDISKFKPGTVTTVKVTDAKASDFDWLVGGIVQVHRDEKEDAYSYQHFTPRTDRGKDLVRNWMLADGIWGDWRENGAFELTSNPDKYDILNENITEFPREKMVAIEVSDSKAEELGLEIGGILLNFRYRKAVYSFQYFIPRLATHSHVRRNWLGSSTGWSDWTYVDSVELHKYSNVYDLNADITAFPKNRITYLKVRGSERSAYGLDHPGTIEVYRASEDPYSYQKFIPIDVRNGILYRSWISGQWGEWV